MPIVVVRVREPGGHKCVRTYALLDTGSTSTFISEALLKDLGVSGTPTTRRISTIESKGVPAMCQEVQLEVVNDKSGEVMRLDKVLSRPDLHLGVETRGTREDALRWPHLRGVPLDEQLDDPSIGLLIGVNVPDALRPLETIAGGPGQPYATLTQLGWTLTGPLGRNSTPQTQSFRVSEAGKLAEGPGGVCSMTGSERTPEAEELVDHLRKFWEFETSGQYDLSKGHSAQDQKVLELWRTEATKVDGHYQLPIPFRDEHPHLPDAKGMALKRLISLSKRLSRDERLHTEYARGVQDLLDKGYAEEVPEDEISRSDGKVWYLPHHPVSNPNKDKVRMVFDCAAKHHGVSLNSKVLSGPDLTNSLIGVLAKYRLHQVAFMAEFLREI